MLLNLGISNVQIGLNFKISISVQFKLYSAGFLGPYSEVGFNLDSV